MSEKLQRDGGIDKICDAGEFMEYCHELVGVYRRAFAGKPWLENLSEEVVRARFDDHLSKPGFRARLAFDQSGRVTGALWYDTPTLSQLEAERGAELAAFARAFLDKYDDALLVWEREIIVDPESQGQGIASRLRADFINELREKSESQVLVLTRMRSNNFGIMRIAEKLNYRKTAITMPCTSDEVNYHEYWFCHIDEA